MSPRNSSSPGLDVFVGLLFVSVAALVVGISLLAVELKSYGWDMAP
ncbi:MAG: hypothetical protein VYA62_08605 [Planctomycetota bacterium]|nr:hypothetical protein [Planctomycetota bacterium]